jgi:hypothetical protein
METKPKIAPLKTLNCVNCGKVTNHDLVHREDYIEDIPEKDGNHLIGNERWIEILKCKACKKPSVYRNEWDDKQQNWVSILIYPIPVRAPREVPSKIRKVFDDAVSDLKKSPSLTAVGIRKCLEGICEDKQAQGDTLIEKINYLGANGFIPLPLSDMMDTTQTIRKIGSHFGNMNISLDEVNVLIKYTHAMLECLYVVQDRINSVRMSINDLEENVV